MKKFVQLEKFSVLKVLLLVMVIFESNGLLSSVIGLNRVISGWMYAVFMCFFCGVALYFSLKRNNLLEIKSFYYPLVAFAVFFFVSFISAGFLFPKPIFEWLPALYVFTPIFVFYFLYSFKFTSKEVIWGLISVSVIISLLLLIDQFYHLSFFDQYERRSTFFAFETRRIVILKNEVIFGFVAVVSLIVSDKKGGRRNLFLMGVASVLFFVQALVMESRMGFLAMGVACITLFYLKGLTKKTFQLLTASIVIVVCAFPLIFSQQIDRLSQMSVDDSESNISIRIESIVHYYDVYIESKGLGIGVMSSSSTHNNVLNKMEQYNIVDTGVFSALFQFGPLGLFIWWLFTTSSLKSYKRYYEFTGRSDPYSASAYAFIISFTISLLPLSFFTAYWCINLGGILLYLMWLFNDFFVRNINNVSH